MGVIRFLRNSPLYFRRFLWRLLGALIVIVALIGGYIGYRHWHKVAPTPKASVAAVAPSVAAAPIAIAATVLPAITQMVYTVQMPVIGTAPLGTNAVVVPIGGITINGNNNIVGSGNRQYNGGDRPDRSALTVATWATLPTQVVKIPTAGCYHQQIPSGTVIEIQVSYGTRVGINYDDTVVEVAMIFAGDSTAYLAPKGHWRDLGNIRSYVVRSNGKPTTVTINVSPADFSR